MPVVSLKDVHRAFGAEVVFDGLELRLYPNEKVGLIGSNGSGKTTLLKLIIGAIEPEIGQISRKKELRIGYLPQEPNFDGEKTVIEEMYGCLSHIFEMQQKIASLAERFGTLSGDELARAMKEYDRLMGRFDIEGGYNYQNKVASVLTGVGIEQRLFNQKTSTLSGGQLSRLGLAKVLLAETDILLLDEPTNHLDLQATEWLEKFLKNYEGAVVLISHDRYLLDKVVCKIVEISHRKAKVWKGNYSGYVSARETMRLDQQRQYEQRKEMVAKTLDFVARNKDQEGMRKVARGRKLRLEKMLAEKPDFLKKPKHEKTIRLGFSPVNKTSDLILRCENLCKQFGELVLFTNLTFDVLAGQKLGITGPNGTGKSTFIKMALGQIEPTDGAVRLGSKLTIGYMDQCGASCNPENTVLEEALLAAPGLDAQSLRGRLSAFLFMDDDVFKKVGQLSGGQQNRLVLCKLVLRNPQALLLDEPTNHLDIPSKEALEEALREYRGTLIVVSHDRFFLDKTVGRLLVIGLDECGQKQSGRFEFVEGSYSRYSQILAQRISEKQESEALKQPARKPKRPRQEKIRKTTPAELRQFNGWSVEKLEQVIIETEGQIAIAQQQFGDEKIYKQPALFAQLKAEYEQKQHSLGLLYRAYELRSG